MVIIEITIETTSITEVYRIVNQLLLVYLSTTSATYDIVMIYQDFSAETITLTEIVIPGVW